MACLKKVVGQVIVTLIKSLDIANLYQSDREVWYVAIPVFNQSRPGQTRY